ncbi:MAG: epoxyqueuosine reductase QueH [Elusimicrobia bacterium]|nr:epoxyqueuosine reductase QueH [Elusimicrobiota bacterium]
MSTLVHVCCGPCLLAVNEILDDEYSAYFFNPNIHNFDEYQRRLMTAGFTAQHLKKEFFYENFPDVYEWVREVLKGNDRCLNCVRLRLEKTAKFAKEKNFKSFTTTLLSSPYQKHDEIKNLGFEIARKYGLEFFYRDFRAGYKKSIEISKKLNLYRQKYCGCFLSSFEKYKL